MKTKTSTGLQTNSTVRSSNMTMGSSAITSPNLGATAQYKKVLSKGPMPMNGKVLDDYDDEEDLYEEDDIDEQSPNQYAKDASAKKKQQEQQSSANKKGKTTP
jgi:hypothetical protein